MQERQRQPEQKPQGAAPQAPCAEGVSEQQAPEQATSDELCELEKQRDDYLDLARRTQADFDNFKKRARREQEQAARRSKAEVIERLLPVVDNLERALGATDSDSALKDGVELVYRELLGVLDKTGVERFGQGGEAFDPNLHEAISTQSQKGVDSGQIVEVAQTGYSLDGTVIRPARVVVAS